MKLTTRIGYEVGRYGPLILSVVATAMLFKFKIRRDVFILGSIGMLFLNSILKILISQRRPDKYKSDSIFSAQLDSSKTIKEKEKHIHSYGMPSGHAQSVAFCVMYIYFTFKDMYATSVFAFFAIWTCIQRVVFKRHYVDQVIAGLLVGSFSAYYVYQGALKLLESKS
tara:strand:+ start:1480 stop:1983 length:504 start_codon:yes stop_codon:yes gene_type:complete